MVFSKWELSITILLLASTALLPSTEKKISLNNKSRYNIAWYKVRITESSDDTLLKTSKELIAYAEPILFRTYGKKMIRSEKPYIISFKNGIWTMSGTLPKRFTLGGTFYTEIEAKDGRVLIMTHFK